MGNPEPDTAIIILASSALLETLHLARQISDLTGCPVRVVRCARPVAVGPSVDGYGVLQPEEAIQDIAASGWQRVLVLPTPYESQPAGAIRLLRDALLGLQRERPDLTVVFGELGADRGRHMHHPFRLGPRWRGRWADPPWLAERREDGTVSQVLAVLRKHGIRLQKQAAVPLTALSAEQTGTICDLVDRRGIVGRLATLGFTPGTDIRMIQNYGWGPVIVIVRDTRIALGRGEAHHIRVIPGALNNEPADA